MIMIISPLIFKPDLNYKLKGDRPCYLEVETCLENAIFSEWMGFLDETCRWKERRLQGLSLVGFSEKLSERGILGGGGEDPSCPSRLQRDEGWRDVGMCSLVRRRLCQGSRG